MIPLLIVSLALFIALLIAFKMYTSNRMPSKKKRAVTLDAARQDMDTWSANLVPLNKEELDLFSLAQDKQVVKTGASAGAKGTFTTIFHEPVVSYAYRKYLGKQVNELLLARTAEHEYVYWTEKGKTSLEIDGEPVGTLDNGTLYGARSGKEIASISATPKNNFLPVSVGNREVGALTTQAPHSKDALSQRAFEFIPDNLSQKEESLLMSLAMRELVKRSLPA